MVRVWLLRGSLVAVILMLMAQGSRLEAPLVARAVGARATVDELRAYAGPDGRFTEPPPQAARFAAGQPLREVEILPGRTAAGGLKVVYDDRWLHELRAEVADRGSLQEHCGPRR